MDTLSIEQIVRAGAASLSQALGVYWPAAGDNEIAEANQTLHVGKAFLDRGFHTYAECHSNDEATRRFDLLALHPSESALVVCEFKRLYNADQARLMGDDAVRVREFAPCEAPRLNSDGIALTARWALVAATTWKLDYAGWFLDKRVTSADPTGGELNRLWTLAGGKKACWGAAPILAYHAESGLRQQWLVYSLFRL